VDGGAARAISQSKIARLVEKEKMILDARRAATELGLQGVIAVNKPRNCTSFQVVDRIRRTLQRVLQQHQPGIPAKFSRIKVGHGGTLDPQATGVLVIGVGPATKLMENYTKGSKCYDAIFQLGFETNTADAEGEQVGESMEWRHVTEEGVLEACTKFVGNIMQEPPIFSALRVGGQRAYDMARDGVDFKLEKRPVTVHQIRLLRPFAETAPAIHLSIECGGGTYIRSIARDMGRELCSAAHMTGLVRTRQGEFELADCLDVSAAENGDEIIAMLKKSSDSIPQPRPPQTPPPPTTL